jgi:hypothetical protein
MKELIKDKKVILGMIHLSGDKPVERALKEIEIYIAEGVHGCIIENYHGSTSDVEDTLRALTPEIKANIKIGINILPNDYHTAFKMGDKHKIDFIQLDYVAGKYERAQPLNGSEYLKARDSYAHQPIVYGGVWPKYYTPIAGSSMIEDIIVGRFLADGLVVTGSGTGKETPLDKIKVFVDILKDSKKFVKTPVIVGAGVDAGNVVEQLTIADGAIVGSCFKPYKRTQGMVTAELVREFMTEFKKIENGLNKI